MLNVMCSILSLSLSYLLCGISTPRQGPRNLFTYLFICPWERSACHVVSNGIQWAEKTGFQLVFLHGLY